MTRARLVLVGGVPPPHHGVTQYTYNVLHSRLVETFDVHHLDTSDHRNVDNLSKLDVINVILAAKNLVALVVLLLRVKPQLVYLPVSVTPLPYARDGLFILLSRFLSRAKVVIHLHGGRFFRDEFYTKANPLVHFFIRWTLHNTTTAIVLGENLRSVFEDLVPHVAVVPNGSSFRPTLPNGTKRQSSSSLQVGFLGNLFEAKGVLDLLESARIICEHHPDVRFVFAGPWWKQEPKTKEKAEWLVKTHGLHRNVSFLGEVLDQAKERFLIETDIFVFPSTNEGFPLVILEAMAASCPVISTKDVGVISEVVEDGVTGILVEKRSPSEIVGAIERLVRDPGLRISMGDAGRRRYETLYTMEKNIERLTESLNETLNV